MIDKETRRLRGIIERPERCQFWGQWYVITPRLISRVFGDGANLLCVTPLATRPNYFAVRIDSSVKDPRDQFPANGQWSLLEDIMLAAEDEYGRFGIDEDGETIKDDDDRGFPVVDWGIGCSWGKPFPVAEWKPSPRRRRLRARRARTSRTSASRAASRIRGT